MTDSASTWIKAQRSYATSQCVELAATENGIEMRNSNNSETVIAHTAAEFAVFSKPPRTASSTISCQLSQRASASGVSTSSGVAMSAHSTNSSAGLAFR